MSFFIIVKINSNLKYKHPFIGLVAYQRKRAIIAEKIEGTKNM